MKEHLSIYAGLERSMEKNKIKKSLAIFATTLIVVIVGVASFTYFGTFDVNLINNVQ